MRPDHHRLVPPLGALALVSLVACGGTPAPSPAEPTDPVPSPPVDGVATAAYALHEWGLVDVAASGAVELASGPGTTRSVPEPPPDRPPVHVRKPVIYAHLLDGTESITFSLRADVPGGRIVESWPDAVVAGDHLEFRAIEASGCRRERRASSAEVPLACRSLDGICEVRDLPTYAASDAACMRVDGANMPHGLLFYRADLPRLGLPAAIARASDRSITVRAADALAGAEVVRIVRDRGAVRVARAGVPSAGAEVVLPLPSQVADVASERSSLHAALMALGLSTGEAEAFCSAWTNELFGLRPARDAAPLLDDVLLYFLPESAIARIAPLTIAPAPRTLRRVWLVRVELPR